MKYSFWKLLRAQWSWNNDKAVIYMSFALGFVWSLYSCLTGTFTNTATGEAIEPTMYLLSVIFLIGWVFFSLLSVLLPYQLAKVLILTFYCYFVTKFAKQGEIDYIEAYEQALVWRKGGKL